MAKRGSSGIYSGSPLCRPGIETALTTLAAASLLVFCLAPIQPCLAAIAAVKRELGGKWAVLVVLWQCGIAWIAAMIVKIIGNLMGVM